MMGGNGNNSGTDKMPDQQSSQVGGNTPENPRRRPQQGPPPEALRYRQEHQMSDEFGAVLEQNVGRLHRLDILKEEQEFVWKFLRSAGVLEGTTAAVFAFICLNRLPRYWARHVSRKQQQPYVLDKTHTSKQPGSSPFQKPDQTQAEQQVNRSRNRFLFTAFELMFDSAMSVGVGIATAIIVADQEEAIKSITDIPLQPGRSTLADQVCPALIDEYRRQWKLESGDGTKPKAPLVSSFEIMPSGVAPDERRKNHHLPFDRREVLRDPHDPLLQVLLDITQNCQHRHVMEQRICEERGLPETAKVDIPEQGVMPETEDPLLNRMLQEEGKDYRDEIYSYQDVANFVKDQEEEQNFR